ncbi:MAG: glycoside hydrolase family 97 protein [Ignavibacteriaceae bacterium]|nr:glycoside hydrolase family 97 protein [Ignavibacteriaceae bacterium]
MKYYSASFFLLILISCIAFFQCGNKIDSLETASPDGNIKVNFFLSEDGTAGYSIDYSERRVIDTSYFGFDFQNAESFKENLEIINSYTSSFDETWETVWGEQRFIRNNYNELKVELQEKDKLFRRCFVVFRVFNDGVGFRFEFPEQENLNDVVILDENTQFKLTGDHTCWWIPGDWDIYEHLFNTTKFSEIDALSKRGHKALAQTYIPENAVNLPVTMKIRQDSISPGQANDVIYISILEANLTNYADMTLKVDKENLLFQSELVGNDSGIKVKNKTPFVTPWRLILIGDEAGDLVSSRTILNLNEPNVIEDVSWIKPTKYIGIWWEMHLGKSTWDMKSGKHGATTENAKRYIDFASKNEIGAVLIEGWNTGWDHYLGKEKRDFIFDFVTPYPDYNLKEVVRYAREIRQNSVQPGQENVQIIMHHETYAHILPYEERLDTAFALCKSIGIHAVKTGYVGQIVPDGEYHHGQWMVNHYRKVMEKAAEYQIMVDVHEPIKPTGLRRTYPNMMSAEGLRGQEFNAWSPDGGNPPEHLTIVPFTRMLAGPIDYTPGIFDIKFDKYKKENQVNTTLAHQLALYVVIYSPFQMAADLPENYDAHPAFQFIRDVGVDWDTSIVLNGEIGEFITIARKERNTDKWFLGSITDENERLINISLNFLEAGKKYTANIYSDSDDSHWDKNPTAYKIESKLVSSVDKLNFKLAPGGGTAISFMLIE